MVLREARDSVTIITCHKCSVALAHFAAQNGANVHVSGFPEFCEMPRFHGMEERDVGLQFSRLAKQSSLARQDDRQPRSGN